MPIETPSIMPDPHTIYQEWLDRTSAALMDGDEDGFMEAIQLPFILRTSGAETVLESLEDLRNDVRNVVAALRAQMVTHYVRLVKKARYLEEDVIEGWHTTYVLRHSMSVTMPYGNRMIMRRIDGAWKVSEADHELSNDRFPVTLLRSHPGSFEETWKGAMADISATHARAEPIYQVFLDSLSQTVNTNDFEGWCNHFTMPHDIHYDATDHVANGPDDVRAFFEMMVEQVASFPGARMMRQAKFAEFLSDDRVFGYHDTIIAQGDTCVFGPVKSRMMLSQMDGRWKCSSVTNALLDKDLRDPEFQVSGQLPTMREIQKRMQK